MPAPWAFAISLSEGHYGDPMGATRRLSVVDHAFLALDSAEVSAHVACLAIFSRPPDAAPEFLRKLVADLRGAETFAAPFNYRLTSSPLRKVAPSWDVLSDDEIDLDYHFRHSALPWPGGERELGVLVSRLHSRPLDPTKPLWECHVIEGLENDRFAIYFKVHHAVMDGVGGSRRLAQMVGPDPADGELRAVWSLEPLAAPPRGRPSPVESVVDTVTGAPRLAWGMVSAAADLVKDFVAPSDPAVGVPFAAPTSPVLNGRVSRQRRVATQSVGFERVRAVAKAGAATVNDVFLAVCAGALRRYLGDLGALPGQSLVTAAPVSLRTSADDERSNAIAFVMVKLGTDIEDVAERFEAIKRSSTVAKDNFRALPDDVAGQYGVLTNGPFILQNVAGLAGRLPAPYNLIISNVPGPMEPQYLRGARLDELYPISVVLHGQALNITGFSTSGRFNIGFVGCRDLLPHMQRLAVYTGEALDELEVALV